MKQTTLDVSTTDIPDDLFTDPFPEQSVEDLQTWVENRINDETIPIADDELAHTIEGKSAFSPDAKFLFGILYEYGIGVARSSEKAEEHILISASRRCADARFHLAVCYETGAFGKVNYFKAAK